MASVAAFLLPLLEAEIEDAATEGKKIITAMLIVGLVFVSVIALGQLSRWARHRRRGRLSRRASQY